MLKNSISIFWRKRSNYYRIKLTKCRKCGRISYPARERCPYCGSNDVEHIDSSGHGKILNYTVSYYRREGDAENMPRIVALVRLDEGVVIPAEIVDSSPEEIKEGMEVEAVLRRLNSDDPYGLIYYGLKFTPVLNK